MYNSPLDSIYICNSDDIGRVRDSNGLWDRYWGWAHNMGQGIHTKMTQSERERKVRLSRIRGKGLLTLIRLQGGYWSNDTSNLEGIRVTEVCWWVLEGGVGWYIQMMMREDFGRQRALLIYPNSSHKVHPQVSPCFILHWQSFWKMWAENDCAHFPPCENFQSWKKCGYNHHPHWMHISSNFETCQGVTAHRFCHCNCL